MRQFAPRSPQELLNTMPIYAYKCDTCGHAKDVLQKMSDAQLVDCPQCGAATFTKQLTSAGFQLKGSGWYVTDFRDNKGAGDKAKESSSSDQATTAPANSDGASAAKADAPASSAKAAATPAATPAAPSNAPSTAAASPAAKAAPAPKAST